MADNINVKPSTDPTAVPVATRQLVVGGVADVDVPYSLVGYETAGGILVPVDVANGLPIRLATNQSSVPVSVGTTIFPSASGASGSTTPYTVGDVVGAGLTFAACALANGGTGTILRVVVASSIKAATPPQLNLWLFSAAPTTAADNAVFDPSDAEQATTLIDVIPLTNWTPANANGALVAAELNRPYKCGVATTSLFGVLTAGNGYTPANPETFTVTVTAARDPS